MTLRNLRFAGSGIYGLCEAMAGSGGLERKPSDARAAYGVIAIAGIGV